MRLRSTAALPWRYGVCRGMTRHAASLRFVLLLITLIACLSTAHLGASRPARGLSDFSVRTWNENDGLFASRITSIGQDANGYLWLGTDVGLLRFDGVRFVPVSELGDVKLPTSPVPALLSASDGSLWISTVAKFGLVRWKDGRATTFGPEQGLKDDGGYSMAILEDSHGVVWTGNRAGLFRFDGKRWQAIDDVPGLTGTSVMALHESRDGRLWASTREAVFRRDRADAPFEQVDTLYLASNAWQGFSEDANGVVWISDFTEGFRPVGEPRPRTPRRSGWGVQLLHDQRDNFWVATRTDGLWRVRGDQVDVIRREDGLATDVVACLFEDREGNIWVGTQAGLQRLTPHRVTPVTDIPIARSAVTTKDGSIWIGNGKGLTRFAPGGRRHYGRQEGLPGRVVLALHVDADEVLWVATELGLARFAEDRFSPLVYAGKDARRIFSIAHIADSFWLRDNTLELGRTSENGQLLPLTTIPDDFRHDVTALAGDSANNLWIGRTEGRLGVLRDGTRFERHSLRVGTIRAMRQAEDGAMWIGGDAGLARVRDGRVQSIGAEHGLPSQVKSIVDDGDDVMWIGFGSGIARIETAEIERAFREDSYRLRYRLFNTADGAAGIPVADGGLTAVRANDGRLWFATSAGLTVIDPKHMGDPRPPAPSAVEGVTADGEQMKLADGLMLPAGVSHVQLLFTALTMTDSLRVEFMYRLDGVDRDWLPAGAVRQASYANLGPGQYTFRVKASYGDGVWGEPAVLPFGVKPKFYQTGWFFSLAACGALSLVYLAWRLNARRVRTQFALVLAERIRMSRAIHDTLLQGFAGLALQLDDLAHGELAPSTTRERLRGIRRRVEDYIREARQSIWDLRSPALERRSLPEALKEVGTRAIADRPVALDVSVKGAPLPFQPVVEQQLLLICQEALSNAVRHGAPNRVDVELEYGTSQVSVRVSDDGRGFDPHTVEKVTGHYGVISMRERAAQVRGRLTIASQPGKGTRVETVVPVS
jgi:signal transduction histidine kinase/ligand-binding sensor domain-containing protein